MRDPGVYANKRKFRARDGNKKHQYNNEKHHAQRRK